MRLGQHMTDESRAKMSVIMTGNTHNLGNLCSDETKAKISLAHIGMKASPETRARMSIVDMGRIASTETRAKMAASASNPSAETRNKMSVAHAGHLVSPETRAKIAAKVWRGGEQITWARCHAKRKALGFVPLNVPLVGCEGHHIDKEFVIYIPKELHWSIKHNVWTGKNMDKINALAYEWLAKEKN